MVTGIMTSEEIRKEGIKALERHLGPDGMIRFLQQFDRGSGDYTKKRQAWLKQMGVKTLAKKIIRRRKSA
jgi:hypothetical protein